MKKLENLKTLVPEEEIQKKNKRVGFTDKSRL